ncbi:MAG: NAD(P)/FAD-dependent oxidoreductase [Bacteroidota bacterium]
MSTHHTEKSYWLNTYGPYSPNAPLEGEISVDVAIIGGGFTGLSTAYFLRKAEPAMKVAVLEAQVVGYGASGRNGGFAMTLFGLEPAVTAMLFGRQRTAEAHRYCERSVDLVRELIREHHIQSDFEYTGFLRLATTPGYVRRIQHDLELLTGMGITGIEWIDAAKARAEVNSPLVLGAWSEARCGILNPARQVRELKRIAAEAGAAIYEGSPVVRIRRGTKFLLETPRGTLAAEKIVFATNAYSHLIPQIWNKQVPAFTHMLITEPLTPSQMQSIGWKNRQGLEDARNLVHYLRLTVDDRIAIGGSDVTIAYGRDMERDLNEKTFRQLEGDTVALFPSLKGIKFVFRWGGPVSVTLQMAPAIGMVGDARAWYSLGCVGHGVAPTHLNGQTLSDLLLERRTDLTDVWFVERKPVPWPPEPFRWVASQALLGYLHAEDWWYERPLRGAA